MESLKEKQKVLAAAFAAAGKPIDNQKKQELLKKLCELLEKSKKG